MATDWLAGRPPVALLKVPAVAFTPESAKEQISPALALAAREIHGEAVGVHRHERRFFGHGGLRPVRIHEDGGIGLLSAAGEGRIVGVPVRHLRGPLTAVLVHDSRARRCH